MTAEVTAQGNVLFSARGDRDVVLDAVAAYVLSLSLKLKAVGQ